MTRPKKAFLIHGMRHHFSRVSKGLNFETSLSSSLKEWMIGKEMSIEPEGEGYSQSSVSLGSIPHHARSASDTIGLLRR